jgi:hypothetical protein
VSIKTGSISVKRKEATTKNNGDDDASDDDDPRTAMLEGQLMDKIQTDEST